MAWGLRGCGLTAAAVATAVSLSSLSGCVAGPDRDQARLCLHLAGAFHNRDRMTDLRAEALSGGDGAAVVARYTAGEDGAEHWVACAFRGKLFEAGRTELAAVATDQTGRLSDVKFHLLRLWAGMRPVDAALGAGPTAKSTAAKHAAPVEPWVISALYLAQQIINAVTAACVYGLLAVGYTLVYAVLGRVNLAMAELTMIGAVVAAMASALVGMAGAGGMPSALLAVFACAAAVSGLYGWAMDRLAFQPFHQSRGHAPLIVAVGVMVTAQEAVRLLQGAREWWPVPPFAHTHALLSAGGFTVTAITAQGVIVWLTVALYMILSWAMAHTRFGRSHRAVTDDPTAAALMGVNVDRVTAATFALGGVYAGAAGAIIALYYGGVGFFTGYQVGFKALTAAVAGGIGSIPGAMLGGALLATVEAFWSAYLPLAYKDVGVFALLALFMIWRPQGIMGTPRGRGD